MVFNPSIRCEDGALTIDDCLVDEIASAVGTPVYIYSLKRIASNFERLRLAFAPLAARLHYSVKANGNLAILRALDAAGAGFDCVSGGEIYRALQAGAKAEAIAFAGVGKTRAELAYAIGEGVGWLNVENALELARIDALAAEAGLDSVRVALRFNPEVMARTHRHIATGHGAAKFGLSAAAFRELLAARHRYPRVDIAGAHMHIGSQLGDAATTLRALDKLLALIREQPQIRTVNLGGGLPAPYKFDERAFPVDELAAELAARLDSYEVLLEPGRAIVADAGLLAAEVLYVKHQAGRRFIILDAGMTELIRPALYDAHHEIAPLRQAAGEMSPAQVAGPVCETADALAKDRMLPRLEVGDRVALLTAGAYGMAMASNYNGRTRPAEVAVDGAAWRVARRRETWGDMLLLERTLSD